MRLPIPHRRDPRYTCFRPTTDERAETEETGMAEKVVFSLEYCMK